MMIAVPAIRSATLADAPKLSAFAADTFRDAFGKENNPADLEMYVAEAFTLACQTEEIADLNSTILLAECVDDDGAVRLIGYAFLAESNPPAVVAETATVQLKRFYVARQWHGRGVAQSLMEAVIGATRTRGARTLWLGVWERNPRAIAFYGKYGFRRVGEQTFVLGRDVQTDWILARDINDE